MKIIRPTYYYTYNLCIDCKFEEELLSNCTSVCSNFFKRLKNVSMEKNILMEGLVVKFLAHFVPSLCKCSDKIDEMILQFLFNSITGFVP